MTWVTNSPDAAELIALADEAYEIARMMAVPLPLADKIVALRNAKNARTEAYEAVLAHQHKR